MSLFITPGRAPLRAVFSCSLMLGCSATAFAQTAVAETASSAATTSGDASPGDNDMDAVGEIIVTAEKREVAINKIGVTVAAFSGDALAKQGIADVQDLAKIVPGLTYSESAAATPVYTLRGVGFYETSLAAYPDVSVYVDQVPLPFPALTPHAGLDLERVEVIKGPQGILFGQNATAGAINYIAAKPTDVPEFGTDFTFGRFNRAIVSGFASGPLSQNVKARLSFKAEHGDDWQYSYTRDEGSGKRRSLIGRVLLDWEPADRIKFELNLNGWIDKSDNQAAQFFARNVKPFGTDETRERLLTAPLAPENNRAADWYFPMRRDNSMWQASLRGDYDISDDIALTSISSYITYKKDGVDQNSGLYFVDEDAALHVGSIKSFTQELRLANSGANDLRWTIGANYEHSNVYESVVLHYSSPNGRSTLADAFALDGNMYYTDQKMRNYAAFGNAELDITSATTIKGGLRYTKADRFLEACSVNTDDNGGGLGELIGGISSAITGQNVVIPLGACALLDKDTFLPGVFYDKLKEDNLSWRVGVDFRPTSSLLLYLNFAKGYKAGSFPTLGPVTTGSFAAVVQEELLDYEAGVKWQSADRRTTLTGAAFNYKYKNKQVRGKLIDPIFGQIDVLTNIPKSRVTGAELNFATRPVSGLDFGASVTYVKAKVLEYVGVNGAGDLDDFANTPLPFSPKWQASGTADYEWDLNDRIVAGIGATVTYNDRTTSVVGGSDNSYLKAYTLIDLRASIGAADDRWTFSVWGRNVTDTYYWTNVQTVYDTSVRYTGQPVTYGGTFSYRFW